MAKVFDGQTPCSIELRDVDMTSKAGKRMGELLADIDPADFRKTKTGSDTSKPVTGVGLVMGAIAGKTEIERKLRDSLQSLDEANLKLASFEGADLVRELDPRSIRRSEWANRHLSNFHGDAWNAFKDEIKHAGRNIEPIKVRRVFDGQTLLPQSGETPAVLYEVVYGHRRHQACLELGMSVRAEISNDMPDKDLFIEMDRENRRHQDLSPWEQGQMYNQALQKGMFSSIRQLCAELGANLSDASRSCKLALLPTDVIEAFPSPIVIQVRWAKPLSDAMQSDPDGTLERARELHKLKGTLKPAEILDRLLKLSDSKAPQGKSIAIEAKGKPVASLKLSPKGHVVVEFQPGALEPNKHAELAKLISDFLGGS